MLKPLSFLYIFHLWALQTGNEEHSRLVDGARALEPIFFLDREAGNCVVLLRFEVCIHNSWFWFVEDFVPSFDIPRFQQEYSKERMDLWVVLNIVVKSVFNLQLPAGGHKVLSRTCTHVCFQRIQKYMSQIILFFRSVNSQSWDPDSANFSGSLLRYKLLPLISLCGFFFEFLDISL